MSRLFEELGREPTAMGDISLRRRWEPQLKVDVFEVILRDEFLMSSLFTTGERALATLGLAATTTNGSDDEHDGIAVLVGGLGLGYTAQEVLHDDRVRTLHVVDTLAAVIGWHDQHLTPLGAELAEDRRCTFVHGDFFALAAASGPMVENGPDRFDAILVDIDHSPRHLLHPSHAGFYLPDGLAQLRCHLHPGAVFGLWSDAGVDDEFLDVLRGAFGTADAHTVSFPNFYSGRDSSSTIYVAR